MAWIPFGALPCRKKTRWQLASRCCWNRGRPWHASELVSFLVGLRTYQHPGWTYTGCRPTSAPYRKERRWTNLGVRRHLDVKSFFSVPATMIPGGFVQRDKSGNIHRSTKYKILLQHLLGTELYVACETVQVSSTVLNGGRTEHFKTDI